jgi:heme-degrading monooxygenase HmoA
VIVVMFSYVMREGATRPRRSRTDRMWSIVSAMPGFISYKAYTAEDGERIAVVRFESREALEAWRTHPEHRATQERARREWFDTYWVQASENVPRVSLHEAGRPSAHPERGVPAGSPAPTGYRVRAFRRRPMAPPPRMTQGEPHRVAPQHDERHHGQPYGDRVDHERPLGELVRDPGP